MHLTSVAIQLFVSRNGIYAHENRTHNSISRDREKKKYEIISHETNKMGEKRFIVFRQFAHMHSNAPSQIEY